MCRSPFLLRCGLERHGGRSLQTKKPHTIVCGQKKKDIQSDVLVLALPIFTVWASYRHAVRNSRKRTTIRTLTHN